MNDKELISEARREESIHDKLGDGFSEGSEERAFYYGHRDRYKRLADALESRQPGENDREATEAEIDKAARALHIAKCCSLSGDSPHDFPEASEVFAAGVVLNAVPRATVPDAATELRAERDAALEAIERVRAEHPVGSTVLNNSICQTCGMPFPCPTVAALDGAPEPEAKP